MRKPLNLIRRRKMDAKTLVESIVTGDEAAGEYFTATMSSRIAERLEVLKVAAASKMMAEEAEQIDELKKSTLASYATKAATDIRTTTSLGRDFEDNKYRAMNLANRNSPFNMGIERQDKDPKKYRKAVQDMKTAGKIESDFNRQAKNRIKGIGRAAARLAKEELKREFDPKDEYPRDQNHPDSLKLKAPKELRKNPKFANRKMKEEVEQVDEKI